MTYSIYSKDRQSLQFPVMCNGYVEFSTADAFSTETTGVWDYQGPFTLEMIITPYEVNGNPLNDNENSQKTLPRDSAGLTYLSSADRHSVEMCLFHNTNLTLSLVNKTTSAFYQPAEYSLKAEVRINSTTVTLESDVVFKSEIVDDAYSAPTDYFYQNHIPIYVSTGVNATNVVGRVVTTQTLSGGWTAGQPVYNHQGKLVGTIASSPTPTTTSFTTDADIANAPTVGQKLYVPVNRDVLYPETAHHVAVSYGSKTIMLFYNGRLVAKGNHSQAQEFQLDNSNIYLGKRGSSGATTTQFMGELHEVAYYKEARRSFKSINSLLPPFKTTLLYCDFEESRL